MTAERTPRVPEPFERRMRDQLGSEADDFLHALSSPETGLRVNTLRIDVAEFVRLAPFPLEPLPFPPVGFKVDAGARPGRHPFHAAGLYYLQDPGAMTVAALLDPQPGERVLDLAAAPGGKSTHIAALMRDHGVLVANDPQPVRARELAGNLERCGVRRAVVTTESAERLAQHFGAWFDRVLLDAPCSGEAMFHKSAAARTEWSPAAVLGCARRQSELLEVAAGLVRPGGRLVYSTCTFSAEENEGVVGRFLDGNPAFRTAALPDVPGASSGQPDMAGDCDRAAELEHALRLWPHRFPGAGHFVVALDRNADQTELDLRPATGSAPGEAVRVWNGFVHDTLRLDVAEGLRMELRGELLWAVPPELPDMSGLRTLRVGWPLGSVRKGRFDPAHALAMGLRSGEALRPLRFSVDVGEVGSWLRGETLTSEGPHGWLVVTVNGYPLGWGKRVGTTIKNHLPKGLRLRAGRR